MARSRLLVALIGVLMGNSAQGQLMQNLSIGNAKAIGLGNAVTATDTGIDAIHFNPAALSRLTQRQLHLKGLVASFEIAAKFGEYFAEAEQLAYLDYRQDPVPGSESYTTDPAVMLPGVGLVEPPLLAFPLGGMSFRPRGSRFSFASGVYSPSGFGYVRDPDDPGSYSGEVVAMTRLVYFSPSVAMQVTDSLSAGVSLGIAWSGLGLKLPARAPHIAIATIEALSNEICPEGVEDGICQSLGEPLGVFNSLGTLEMELEDPMSLSVNLGLLWDPVPWFSLGIVYQSEGVAKLEGDFAMHYQQDWADYWQRQPAALKQMGILPYGNDIESGTVKTELIQPQHAAFGISVQLLPSWRVNIDYKWTDTGAWDVMKFEFSRSIDLLKLAGLIQPAEAPNDATLILPRHYESTTSWAIGVEYKWNDRLALRLGVEERPSGIPSDRQDLLFPVADSYFYGAGFQYKLNADTVIDMGVGYLKSQANVPANTSYNANYSGYRQGQPMDLGTILYNPYAGIDFSTQVKAYLVAVSYQTVF